MSCKIALFPVSDDNAAHFDAHILKDTIARLSGVTCEEPPPYNKWWQACGDHPKPGCEVIYVTIVTNDDKRKFVHVHIEEHPTTGKPTLDGEVGQVLTCSAKTDPAKCIELLIEEIAKAVVNHDKQCHRGTPCQLLEGHFVP